MAPSCPRLNNLMWAFQIIMKLGFWIFISAFHLFDFFDSYREIPFTKSSMNSYFTSKESIYRREMSIFSSFLFLCSSSHLIFLISSFHTGDSLIRDHPRNPSVSLPRNHLSWEECWTGFGPRHEWQWIQRVSWSWPGDGVRVWRFGRQLWHMDG